MSEKFSNGMKTPKQTPQKHGPFKLIHVFGIPYPTLRFKGFISVVWLYNLDKLGISINKEQRFYLN